MSRQPNPAHRRAIDLAISAVPGSVFERLTAAGAPLARHSGRTRAGAGALGSALRMLTRPPRQRTRPDQPASLEIIADEVGRPPEDVLRWADAGMLGSPLPDGTWDSAAVDRAALIAFAFERGASEAEVSRAVDEGRLPLLVLERVVAGRAALNAAEVASRAGISVELATSVWRALGFPADDLEAPLFTRRDVEAMRVLGAMRTVFTDSDLLEMNSVIGRAMSEVAAAAVELFQRRVTAAFVDAGVPELEASLRLAAVTELLVPPIGPIIEVVLRHHLAAATQAEAAMQIEQAGAGVETGRSMAVAFADMVGFTSVSERLSPLQVAQLATRLLRAAESALAPHGARIVKSIGDAVMFTARDPVSCCAAALDLVEAAAAEGLPPVRAGVANGPVLRAYADYFGRTVNVASRLCERAPGGGVLVATGGETILGSAWGAAGLVATPASPMSLRGVKGRTAVLRVNRSASGH